MTLKNDKFCINKKFLMVILILIAIISIYPFIYSRMSYKSSAAVRRITPTPTLTPLTIDPKKVIERWLNLVEKKNKEQSRFTNLEFDEPDKYKKMTVYAGSYISRMTHLGDLDYEKNYGSTNIPAKEIPCISEFTLTDPLGLIFNELKNSNKLEDSGLHIGNQTLSFYKNEKEISIILTSWKTKNGTEDVYAMRHFSYKSILNSFSKIFNDSKDPITSAIEYSSCNDLIYKKWRNLAEDLIKNQIAENNISTPYCIENIDKEWCNTKKINYYVKSGDIVPISKKISDFTNKFTAIYSIAFPELLVSPLISKKSTDSLITEKFPVTVTGIGSYLDINQLTYYVDKCGTNESPVFHDKYKYANFFMLKILLEGRINDYLKYYDKIQKYSRNSSRYIYVVSGKTFLNYPTKICKNDSDYNNSSSACPAITEDIPVNIENSFYLTIKPIDDQSCKLYDEKPITYMIYLGN